MSQQEQRTGARRTGLFTLGLCAGWAAITVYTLHAAMPSNPIELPLEATLDFKLLLPEGWAFFTRDPREPDFHVYRREADGRWVNAAETTRFLPRHAFGLDRQVRALGVEMGVLLEQAKAEGRVECKGEAVACLEEAPPVRVNNPGPRPTLCGAIGVVYQKPVPWAWSRSNQRRPISMPTQVVRLEVQC